ncbi:MAG: alpha/beta hydrolase [Miltoncostaeaceae bacterium]
MDTALEPIHLTSRDGRAMKALLAEGDLGAPGVVILHGYGSRKDNHTDFAARLRARGLWALVPDLRGHGGTPGPMDEGMIGDVLACLDDLTHRSAGALGLRGSSMGGFLALTCAPLHTDVRAVVALCPARPESLATRLGDDWPLRHPLGPSTWRRDGIARGFWHATGDEVVPWGNTYDLWSRATQPKHLRVEMGGHHRSLQHDPRIQADTEAFLLRHLASGDTTVADPSPTFDERGAVP